ncbi:hypothetical protein HU200_029237 [Digitaria exilis]|uniref:Uncharacterized protein n=1 Tax=Digitaria exilis TaxID=1010633 RepID=A0A835BTJ0_9POAL|nr:hypothetical protein HU200_029237 [Digitaria exilis]
MRVVHHTRVTTFNSMTSSQTFQLPDIGESYMLSARNDFISFGNGMQTTLYGHKYRNSSGGAYNNITCCVSSFICDPFNKYRNCTGSDGFCHAPIFPGSIPKKIEFSGIEHMGHGFPTPAGNSSGQCPGDVAKRLCRSKLSSCRQENGGYTCYCNKGYQGNPYIPGQLPGLLDMTS